MPGNSTLGTSAHQPNDTIANLYSLLGIDKELVIDEEDDLGDHLDGTKATTGASSSDRFLDMLNESFHTYDENLLYACREYAQLHELNYKKHLRDQSRDLIQKNTSRKRLPIRAWLLLRYDNPFASKSGTCYFAVQTMLAAASVASLCFESSPEYNGDVFPPYRTFWPYVDLPVAILLSLDLIVYYVLLPRSAASEYSNGVCKRNFLKQTRVWIDIISTLPTFLTFLQDVWQPFGGLGPLKVLRVLRLVRALRVLHSVDMLLHTLERSVAPLLAPLALFVGIVMFLSTAIYFAEKGDYDELSGLYLTNDCDCETSAQSALYPDFLCPMRASAFISIPHAMWFVVVTITNVGYGDLVPLCSVGKFLAVICMFLGRVVIAMPIAIVGMYYTSIVLADRAGKRHDPAQAFGRKIAHTNSNGASAPKTLLSSSGDGGTMSTLLWKQKSQASLSTEQRKRRKKRERAFFLAGMDDAVDDDDENDDGTSTWQLDTRGVDAAPDQVMALFAQSADDAGYLEDSKNKNMVYKEYFDASAKAKATDLAGAVHPLEAPEMLGAFRSHDGSPALMILESIAELLEDPSLAFQSLSLLSPDLSILREVNLIIQQQFRDIVQQSLTSPRAVAVLQRRACLMGAPLGVRLISKPLDRATVCDPFMPLVRAVPFALMSGDGAARARLQQRRGGWRGGRNGEAAKHGIGSSSRTQGNRRAGPSLSTVMMLPIAAPSRVIPEVGHCQDSWVSGWLDTTTGHMWVSASQHCSLPVEVNQERLLPGATRKLHLGDVLTVYRSVPRPTAGGGRLNTTVPVRLELLRVDGGGGVPQVHLAPQSLELRVLPNLAAPRSPLTEVATHNPQLDLHASLDDKVHAEMFDEFISVEPVLGDAEGRHHHHEQFDRHAQGRNAPPPAPPTAVTRASGLTFQDYQPQRTAAAAGDGVSRGRALTASDHVDVTAALNSLYTFEDL